MRDPAFDPHNKTAQQITGHTGEDAVARKYIAEGYVVRERNLHIGRMEIDLIVQSKTHLVFVEVKTRHTRPNVPSRYGRPADAIDKGKRARTVAAAEAYLRAHRAECERLSLQPRIDVAEVYMGRHADGEEEILEIKIFRNAFGARS